MDNLVLLIIVLLIFGVLAPLVILSVKLYEKVQKGQKLISDLEKRLINSARDVSSTRSSYAQNPQNELASQLISQIKQGIVCIDKDHKILFSNSYANQFIDIVDIVGKPCLDVLQVQTKEANIFAQKLEIALKGSSFDFGENISIISNRGKFAITASFSPIVLNGSVEAVVFMFSDKTQELARISEERDFVSAAAHELRSPLTAIRATITLIRDYFEKLDKDKIKELLNDAEKSTVELLALITDYLNLTRIERGKLEVKKEPVDIQKLTDEVIAEQLPVAKQRHLYINHQIDDPALRLVTADNSKVKEVLINLVSNAIKYTQQGGITIVHTALNSHVATKVIDTGMGIAADEKLLLFRNFGQSGYARRQQASKSTGLGLYISKKLAQLMSGDIFLEKSEPGKGSTFVFTLPKRS